MKQALTNLGWGCRRIWSSRSFLATNEFETSLKDMKLGSLV